MRIECTKSDFGYLKENSEICRLHVTTQKAYIYSTEDGDAGSEGKQHFRTLSKLFSWEINRYSFGLETHRFFEKMTSL